jgi:hypothetical protein
MAVVLDVGKGKPLILQRIGGNPFDDEATRGLTGKEIAVEGFTLGDIFRYVKAEPSR